MNLPVTQALSPPLSAKSPALNSLRREFDSAHQHLDQADALLTDNMPRAQTLVLLERGRAHNSSNNQQTALIPFRQAFQISDAHHLDDLADAAHMLGIAESGERAERWNLIAIAIAETSDDPGARRWLGPLYNNLGWTYFDADDFDKALDLFVKGVSFRKSMDQTLEWQIARWTVARTYREVGRVDEAKAEQLALLKEVSKEGMQLGYVNEELGELYLTQDNHSNKAHFATAYQILSEDDWLLTNEADRLARLKSLGGLSV